MKKKIILIIITVLVISVFFIKSINEDSWICTDNGWKKHGEPSSLKPNTVCSKIEKEKIVEKYLQENLSSLSNEKEVLGGKFYITKISWIGDNSGIVEYEDGHIALKASFEYKLLLNEENNDYSVLILNFKNI